MRTLLMFDLPSITNLDKKNYRYFVKHIKKEGFYMLQESVYVKFTLDHKNAMLSINRVEKYKPSNGSIFILTVTEKQFNSMKILLGDIETDVVTTSERYIKI